MLRTCPNMTLATERDVKPKHDHTVPPSCKNLYFNIFFTTFSLQMESLYYGRAYFKLTTPYNTVIPPFNSVDFNLAREELPVEIDKDATCTERGFDAAVLTR